MKPIYPLLFSLTTALALSGCGGGGGGDDDDVAECATLPMMNDGEEVTYVFREDDGSEVRHTITKLEDGDPAGDILYTTDTGGEAVYSLSQACYPIEGQANTGARFTREAAFLLTGGALLLDRGEFDFAFNYADSPFGIPPSNTPAGYELAGCEDKGIDLEIATFTAESCTYLSEETGGDFFVREMVFPSEESPTVPLRGLISYREVHLFNNVTVELVGWNGL